VSLENNTMAVPLYCMQIHMLTKENKPSFERKCLKQTILKISSEKGMVSNVTVSVS
jgi:hypothetical protein